MMRKFLLILALVGLSVAQQATTDYHWHFATQTATGTTANVYVYTHPDKHTEQVAVTGAPTTCTVALEGSLDGTSFFNLSGDQSCTSSFMLHIVDKPVGFVRVNLKALSGGTSPSVQVDYVGVR